jgi:hypothetical protein
MHIIYRGKNILKIFSKTAISGMVFAFLLVQTYSNFQPFRIFPKLQFWGSCLEFILLKRNAGFLRWGNTGVFILPKVYPGTEVCF